MRQDWVPNIFKDLDEANEWIYPNAIICDVVINKKVLELISSNKKVFKAFLGKREPLGVSFYFKDLDGQEIDGSEIFLIVNKFELTLVEGLWNHDEKFSFSMAFKVFLDKFEDLNKDK